MSRGLTQQKFTGTEHKHVYAPRGGCKEIFESRAEEVLVSGPAGTGKSRACLEKIFMVCMMTRNTRALILRKTQRSLGSTALVTWRNFVIKEALETGDVVYYGGSQQEPAQYRFKNGSTVTIGGLDNPTRIMSSEYDIVYVQEATEITITDLEFIKTRLRNWQVTFQQLIMDCNPAGDKHWLKLRCNDGKCVLIESRHEDNPRLFDECPADALGARAYAGSSTGYVRTTDYGAKYIAILDNLTGVRHKRLRLGLWVSAEGIVYEEFDPAIHVLDWEYDDEGNRVPLPEDWPRYWTIDFGYVHPFVLKCYALDPAEDTLYMYREIHYTQRLVEEHASQIMSLVTKEVVTEWYDHFNKVERKKREIVWTEPMPVAVICDHDAEGRKTFEKYTGLGTQKAIKFVRDGIDLHKARLKRDARGLARFYLMKDALVERDPWLVQNLLPTCTEEEYAGYIWKVSPDGRIQDEPVKRDDDGMDADRYMTAHLDYRGTPRITLLDYS
ncbi:MAG TPA: phage terminase large subunit [Candidatus Eisenbacteria bacterium]|nr:phage terminase large subunit [Candidatus Eisenbacteria bacterium]